MDETWHFRAVRSALKLSSICTYISNSLGRLDFRAVPTACLAGGCGSHHAQEPVGSPQRLAAPHPPSLVPQGHWPSSPQPHTGQGSNCFLHTKKTLSEEGDLASEKCWSLDLLPSSEGQLGLRNDEARTSGCEGLGWDYSLRMLDWRHRAPNLPRMLDIVSYLPLRPKALSLRPLLPDCLCDMPKT